MAVPSTPTNFYVQQGNAQVFLSWDITATATSYSVQRSTDGVTFTSLATPAVNNYLDTTTVSGTQYWYQVAATNGTGTGSYTTAQSIIPAGSGDLALGTLRLLSQQRADRVNSNFVTLPEWNSYINQSYFELYDLLTTVFEDYYVAPPAIFTTNSQFGYQLPDGVTSFNDPNGNPFVARPFYKLLGCDAGLNITGNAWITLSKFDFIQRNRYIYPQLGQTILGPYNGIQYRIMGNQIEFIPTPQAGILIRLWYIPRMATLLKDTDIAVGVNGWLEYVIVDSAIKALQKEESDVSVLMAQKMALKARIEESAMNRDAGIPDTISDTRTSSGPWGVGPQGDGPYGGW